MKKLKSLIFLILLPVVLFSQELPRDKQFIKDKYNIKLNYGIVYSGWTVKEAGEWTHKHNMGFEFNYGFTKWLDAGVFFDFIPIEGHKSYPPDSIVEVIYGSDTMHIIYGGWAEKFHYKLFNYGLNANIHILPLFLDDPNFSWVDVYITSKIGVQTLYAKQIDLLENKFYYSIGAGVGVNFTRKFGLMCEYNYSRRYRVPIEVYDGDQLVPLRISNSGHMMRFGINIRF